MDKNILKKLTKNLSSAKKPTYNTVKKVKSTPTKKTIPKQDKKQTIIIKNKGSEDNFKLEDKAIYLFTLRTCPYCQAIKSDWEKAKKQNPTTQIYEVHAPMVNHYPMLSNIVVSYPTILKYDNKKFKAFENNRNLNNFSDFMKK